MENREVKVIKKIQKRVKEVCDGYLSRTGQLLFEILAIKNYKHFDRAQNLYSASTKAVFVTLDEYSFSFIREFRVKETFFSTLEEALREVERTSKYTREVEGEIFRDSLISRSKINRRKELIEVRFNPHFGPIKMLDELHYGKEIVKEEEEFQELKASHLSLVID